MHHDIPTQMVCSQLISFNLDGDVVKNISFMSGCNGNLKAISRLVDGWTVDQIEDKLTGIECGRRGTSCSDQLAKAVRAGLLASQDPNYRSPLEDIED